MWGKQTNNITVLNIYYPEGIELFFLLTVCFSVFCPPPRRPHYHQPHLSQRWLTFNYASGPAGSSLR